MENIDITKVQIKDLQGVWLSTNQIQGRSHCLKIGLENNLDFAELSLLSPTAIFQTKKVQLIPNIDRNTLGLAIDNIIIEIKHIEVATKKINIVYINEMTLNIRNHEIVFFNRNNQI